MAEMLDPEFANTFGSPDASLEDWLANPASAEWVKQKALEHAQSTLGYTDAMGNQTGTEDDPFGPGKSGRAPPAQEQPFVLNKDGSRLTDGRTYTDQPAGAVPPPPINETPFDPTAQETVPVPAARPKEAGPGASDISAKKRDSEKDDAITDFAKTLGAVKALQPPPVNPVGTPSVRSPGAINAPQIAQLLQLIGSQSKPDPVSTLGRLLVAGKA